MFESHPEIGVPAPKELRYFRDKKWSRQRHQTDGLARLLAGKAPNKDSSKSLERIATELRLLNANDKSYLGIFGQMKAPVVGEITPQYCLLADAAINRMVGVAPDAKAILLIRDPVARSISGSKMQLGSMKKRNLRNISFDDASVRKRALADRQMKFSQYSRFLDRFEKAFEGRFFIGLFDDIVENPHQLLKELCAFLGVSYDAEFFKVIDKKVNAGREVEVSNQTKLLLFNKLQKEYDFLEERFPDRVRVWKKQYSDLADSE